VQVRRTQDERKAETRQRLLEAATALIAERGVAGTSIDALAEAADRTSGAVYAHFGGKEGVLVALLDELKDAVSAAIMAESHAEDDDDQHLAVLWHNFVAPPPLAGDVWVLLEHELWLYACRNPEARPLVAERYESARRGIAESVATDDGEPDAGEPDDAVGTLLIGLMIGLEMQRRLDPTAVPDEVAYRGMRALLASR
jgi:AcrR family transcriptional regulator